MSFAILYKGKRSLINCFSPAETGGSLTVKNITNELVDVAEWEPVGVYLGISAARLAEIRASRMNNAPLCKISMADTWLRGHVDASWEKLAQALDSSGNSDQAARVRENYGVFCACFLRCHKCIPNGLGRCVINN